MPYLICDQCNHYYEVEDEEEFTHCECGHPLIKVDELSEFYGPEVLRESISTGNTYTEEMAFDYYENQNKGKNLKIIGILLIISGLALIFFNLIFIIFTMIGVGLYLYSQSFISMNELKGKGWAKGLEGEDIVSQHLKELPHDYFIYNDVNLPGKRGNIDHVVIGPNGIFVIETKNYTGQFVIKDKDWFYYKNGKYHETKTNPAKQVLRNTMELKKFLETKGVDDSIWYQAIVALKSSSFKVPEKPKAYKVLLPQTVPKYILNQTRNYDIEILKKAAIELEPYCVELSFLDKMD